jgi:hypothetical protein
MPAQLSESLHHQLNMYAISACAAGVGMLALAQPAEAKIVYTKTNCILGNSRTGGCLIDFGLDGGKFTVLYNHFENGVGGELFVQKYTGEGGGRLLVAQTGTAYTACSQRNALALRAGRRIEPNSFNCPSNGGVYWMFKHGKTSQGRSFSSGRWKDVTNRYLGIKFSLNNEIHVGWARCRVKLNSNGQIEAALTGYAYETIPNKPIIAGKTHGKDEATLGRLAQGASNVSNGGKP